MVAANFNYFHRVDLVVKGYIDGAVQSRTYKFVSQALKEQSSGTDYWPILGEVGEITLAAGEYIPSSTFGGFTLINTIGSFGANRKFSDVLERFDPTEQTVTFYVAQVANDTDSVSSWTQLGVGICTNWSNSINSLDSDNTISFEVTGYRLPETIMTLEVNNSVSGMENAPDGSLGRAVPLSVGFNIPGVVPIRITADDVLPAKYAHQTLQFEHSSATDSADNYIFVRDNEVDEWTLLSPIYFDTTAQTVTGSFTLNTYSARAVQMSGQNGVSYGVRLVARGNGSGGRVSTAVLKVSVLETDDSLLDPVEIATTRVNLTNYDTQNNVGGGTEFNITLGWERTCICKPGYLYFLAFSCTGYAANELSLAYYSAGTVAGFVLDNADSSGGQTWKYLVAAPLKMKMLGYTTSVELHVDSYTQTGLTYGYVQLAASTAVDSGQTAPALNNTPLLLGNLSSTVPYDLSAEYLAPHEIVEFLAYSWNGSAFVDSGMWDTSRYSSVYAQMYANDSTLHIRQRTIGGAFDSRVTYGQVLTEICRASASRVGLLSDGKLFMYPWGMEQDAVASIPSADISPESWERSGVETVVNRIKINMQKDYGIFKNYLDNSINEGRTTFGYTYSNDFSATSMPAVADITQQSRALYGDREASEVNFDIRAGILSGDTSGYLSSDQTVQDGYGSFLAEYYLTRFGLPATYATFIVPYHRYSTLEMFDVIRFAHPEFPCFFGTDPDAREPVYEDTNTYETNLIDGHEWVRAQTYRGLIESKTYIMPVDHAPAIRLRVLVLLNPKDPT